MFCRAVWTSVLEAVALQHGFKRFDDCKIYKIEDDFLKVISAEISRFGGAVYLYYFCNPLADPSPNALSAYTVGARISRASPEGGAWQANGVEDIEALAPSIHRAIEDEAMPFLSSMTWERFAEIRGKKLINSALAISYAKLGRFHEIRDLMDEDLKEIEASYEGDRYETLLTINRSLHDLAKYPQELEQKLSEWRDRNLRLLTKS